jgi:hypothetical protein
MTGNEAEVMAYVGKALLAFGALLFVGAVGWWYAFFEQILGRRVKTASECFYYTTDACSLASVAGYLGDIPTYSPLPFWLSIAVMLIGLILTVRAPRAR